MSTATIRKNSMEIARNFGIFMPTGNNKVDKEIAEMAVAKQAENAGVRERAATRKTNRELIEDGTFTNVEYRTTKKGTELVSFDIPWFDGGTARRDLEVKHLDCDAICYSGRN